MSPVYGWAGPGEMREMGLERAHAPVITEPVDVTPTTEKVFRCDVDGCGRKFRVAMLMARHFNTTHADLREDKDSWREYAREDQV